MLFYCIPSSQITSVIFWTLIVYVKQGCEKQHGEIILVQMLCIVQADAITQDAVSGTPRSYMDISIVSLNVSV